MAKPRDAKANKAAIAEAKATRKAAAKERRSQLWVAFNMQRREDKLLLPYMIGAFVLVVAVSVAAGLAAGGVMITLIPLGVVLGALVAFIIFSRRAQRSVYRRAEGQTGAAAWALDNLRGKWRVTQGVAATKHLEAVHQVIGRPGVILVGEGSSASRVKALLAQEKKKIARSVGDVPIYDIIVGNGDGEIPLAKLQRHLTRLPANINVKQLDELESKLSGLRARTGMAGMPKGPLPAAGKMRGVQHTVRRR